MFKRMIGMVIFFWAFSLSAAYAVGLEVAVGGWLQNSGGTVGYKAFSAADLLDIDDDLKYDTELQIQGRVKIELPFVLPNIYLVAAPAEFEAIGRKGGTFTFGDQTFAGNVDFHSKFKFDQYDIGFYYGIPFLKTVTADKVNIDLGINVRIFDIEARFRQDATGISEDQSATAVLPQVYLAFQFAPVKRLALEGEIRAMSIDDNTVYSLIGRVRYTVFGPVFIAGGYRYDKVDIDQDDVVVDFDLQGPFAEIGFKF